MVARVISMPHSRSSSALRRYKGRCAVYLFTIVSMTIRSETRLFSMIRGGKGAMATPCSSHCLQARFSRWITST